MVLAYADLRIRRCLWQSLVLFFFLQGCADNDKASKIAIRWEEDRAVAISVPRRYFSQIPNDSINNSLHVHLFSKGHQPAILGEYDIRESAVIFRPLIPFTRGLTYEIRVNDSSIGNIDIPTTDSRNAPLLKAIFPTQDTLPYNLLKIYFQFSRPMREGPSLQYISLLENGKDSVPGVFLDLQPELWNREGTLLTVWLDPGRIKRDLQPNQRLGAPLENGIAYQLVVSSTWTDTQGTFLTQDYRKVFFVTSRDSLSPDPKRWMIRKPEAETRKPLKIDFYEPLDAVLIREGIRITDEEGHVLSGSSELINEEKSFLFVPDKAWSRGKYFLQCEGRVEDLAGNNLNRPFDRDISVNPKTTSNELLSREFRID